MAAATATVALLLRLRGGGGGGPLLRARAPLALRRLSTAGVPPPPREPAPPPADVADAAAASAAPVSPPVRLFSGLWADQPDYRQWKDREAEILNDIEPVIFLAKEILHSSRYRDGERLTDEDEKEVVEKLLAYHPHSEDKIGCGLHSIMVDRHPQFRKSRCLFVVRTDGGWIDFSYQKCLRQYLKDKYPALAERFIKEHFKRS